MIKVNIYNKQAVLNWSATFETQELADAWINEQINNNSWGLPARWIRDSLMSPLSQEEIAESTESRIIEISPAIAEILDENNNVIQAAQAAITATEYRFAAHYTIEQLDITTEINLNKLRVLRDEKLKRLDLLVNIAFLNSWTAGEKTELKNYRTALLDITEPYKNGEVLSDAAFLAFQWPVEPTEA